MPFFTLLLYREKQSQKFARSLGSSRLIYSLAVGGAEKFPFDQLLHTHWPNAISPNPADSFLRANGSWHPIPVFSPRPGDISGRPGSRVDFLAPEPRFHCSANFELLQ